MNNYPLAKWQCIVALDEGGTGWIIARSDFIRERDVLMECSAEDNGFNRNWDNGLSVGVYLVTLNGWSHHDSMTGDFDCGVDVVKCKPLWTVPEMNYLLDTKPPHLDADGKDSSHDDDHDCGEDTCVCTI